MQARCAQHRARCETLRQVGHPLQTLAATTVPGAVTTVPVPGCVATCGAHSTGAAVAHAQAA